MVPSQALNLIILKSLTVHAQVSASARAPNTREPDNQRTVSSGSLIRWDAVSLKEVASGRIASEAPVGRQDASGEATSVMAGENGRTLTT